MLAPAWNRPMFTINYTGPRGTRTQSFEQQSSMFEEGAELVSTDGRIIVMEGILGWNAFLYPDWRRVHWWGYRTKELAAFAGILASLDGEGDA